MAFLSFSWKGHQEFLGEILKMAFVFRQKPFFDFESEWGCSIEGKT